MIVAMDLDGVIGRDSDLPWHLPADLKHFKDTTMGCPMIMGRRTYDAIGRPLPGRTSVVITRDDEWYVPGVEIVNSIAEALDIAGIQAGADGWAWVIGGGAIYAALLPHCERLLVTHVEARVEGDTWFPYIDWDQWVEVSREQHPVDEKNTIASAVATYERV
jgi:dihydrofolate reductase